MRSRGRPRRLRSMAAVALLALGTAGGDDAWTPARPGFVWSFPRDHWSHPGYKTEWWYFTGELSPVGSAEPAPRFGYQFTVFRVGLLPTTPALDSPWAASDLFMGHLAITDVAAGRHVFSEVLYRAMPLLAGFDAPGGDRVAWSRPPPGGDGTWRLDWNGTGFAFAAVDRTAGVTLDLVTRPEKPLVLHGDGGFSRKGERADAASLYYSFTRLATAGTLAIDGRRFEVTGTSWMDKEFGSNQLEADQVGWDWFSLRLDDGRDLMLYALRRADGAIDYATGSSIDPDGAVRTLDPAAWSVTATDRWTSPDTGAVYPSGWRLELAGGETLRIEPRVADTENVSALITGLAYWEGPVLVRDVDGAVVGSGYVELTGYGDASRPAL